MANPEYRDDEGWVEKLARKNTKKSLLFLGGLALAAVLLPVGATIAANLAAGAGVEAIGSKAAHDRLKQKRLRKNPRR